MARQKKSIPFLKTFVKAWKRRVKLEEALQQSENSQEKLNLRKKEILCYLKKQESKKKDLKVELAKIGKDLKKCQENLTLQRLAVEKSRNEDRKTSEASKKQLKLEEALQQSQDRELKLKLHKQDILRTMKKDSKNSKNKEAIVELAKVRKDMKICEEKLLLQRLEVQEARDDDRKTSEVLMDRCPFIVVRNTLDIDALASIPILESARIGTWMKESQRIALADYAYKRYDVKIPTEPLRRSAGLPID